MSFASGDHVGPEREASRRTCQSVTYISEDYLSNFLDPGQSLHSLVQLNLCPRVEGKCIKVRDELFPNASA